MAIAADTPAQTARLKRKLKLSFTTLVDPKLLVIEPWGLKHDGLKISVPATFVLRRGGRIAWRRISTNVWDRATPKQILTALDALKHHDPHQPAPSTKQQLADPFL